MFSNIGYTNLKEKKVKSKTWKKFQIKNISEEVDLAKETFFSAQTFVRSKLFFGPNSFWPNLFFGPNFFLAQTILAQTFFWPVKKADKKPAKKATNKSVPNILQHGFTALMINSIYFDFTYILIFFSSLNFGCLPFWSYMIFLCYIVLTALWWLEQYSRT